MPISLQTIEKLVVIFVVSALAHLDHLESTDTHMWKRNPNSSVKVVIRYFPSKVS